MAVVVCCLSLNFLHSSNAHAAAGTNQQLNFQGRLLDNTGAVVPDGSYNMEFKIYQNGDGCVSGGTSPCSGTLKWTEDWIQTNRVTVKNGYFSVNLGSISAFGSNIDWNQDTLWLSTNVGGVTNTPTPTWDGEMTPFKRLASSPYALNSAQLGGLTAANFVQLAQGIQTDSSTVNPSIFINKTGATANIVELQSSNSDVFTVANNGDITATGKYNGDTINGSAITFGSASTANINAASGQTLQLGASSGAVTLGADTTIAAGKTLIANGSALFENSSNSPTALQIQSATAANTLLTADTTDNKVVVGDATGTNTDTTQFIVDSSTVDPSSGADGSIYYNSTSDKFRCYQAGVWADCLGATANSTLSVVSGLANVGASQTGTPVETLVFTSATAVSNTAGATGFTAAAGGSFRTCLIKNNAAITAGTLSLRWRVNGVSVGADACTMSNTVNRSSSTALDAGVVTFSAGDTIGIAFDTSASYLPITDDYTVYWNIEYNSTLTNAGATLQSAYNNNNVLTTTDTHDLVVNAADTATDANVLFNLECVTSCGSNGRFAVQNNGADVFSVAPNSGNILLSPAGTGDVVVSSDADTNFQVNYSSTTDDTEDIAHINILDNANASTGSLYGIAVVNNDNGTNTGVPDALGYLKNANAGDTVPDGLLVEQTGAGTLTNGAEIKQTAGAITNGLQFTGTFTSVLKVGSNTVLNGTGVVQSASISGTYSNALTLSNATNAYTGATYNTLALNGQTDGFTIAGGTTSRTLTVTGANITLGSTITPTSTGVLAVQSNGAFALNLDTGGAASVNIGNTNATGVSICNSAACDTVNIGTNTDADAINIGDSLDTTTIAGAVKLSNLTNCASLSTNGTGTVGCSAGPDTANFTDTTPGTMADNNTSELFNDTTRPNITPISTSQTVLVSVRVKWTPAGANDILPIFAVARKVGGNPTCGTDPRVGEFGDGYTTNTGTIHVSSGTMLDSPAAASATEYTVCASSDSNLGSTATINEVDVTLVALGADYAENYYTTDSTIGPGDVVSIDGSLPAGAKKSTGAYDKNVLGIVSTAPYQVADDKVGASQGRAIPVALAGRVPVKVTTENGPIQVGDLLTTSATVPGAAMKATRAGQIVGQAMTAYSGSGIGEVFAFVKTSYSTGPSIDDLMQSLNITAPDGSTDNSNLGTNLLTGLVNLANQTPPATPMSDMTTDRLAAAAEIITPKLTADTVQADSLQVATGSDISLKLGSDGHFIISDPTGKSVVSFDAAGNATFAGTITATTIKANQIEGMDVITDKISSLAAQVSKDNAAASSSSPPDSNSSALSVDAGDASDLLSLNNVQAANLTVLAQLEAKGGLIVDGNATFNGLAQFKGAVSFNNDAGGTAVIKKGATSVQVKFATAYQTTPIITANYLFNNTDSTVDQANQLDLLTNGYSFIVTQTSAKGFTILLNKAADHNTNFSWLATQIDNPQISQSTAPVSSSN